MDPSCVPPLQHLQWPSVALFVGMTGLLLVGSVGC